MECLGHPYLYKSVCMKWSNFPYILLTAQEVRLFTLLPGQRAKSLHGPLINNSVIKFALYFSMKLHIHYATNNCSASHTQSQQRSSREGAQK